MRPISITELKELAKRLPPANEARDPVYHVMREPDYRDMYRYDPRRYDRPWDDMHVSKVTFEAHRGHLDGTQVWYWTHRGLIVRADV